MTGAPEWIPPAASLDRPSAARIYDYLLGGAHNFEIDRTFAKNLIDGHPFVREMARLNRAFLRRAVLLMMDAGIRQFLDLGSGIPTVGNVHEIAQEVAPDSRVVYVDYEAVAVAHTELLLKNNENATIVHADATDTEKVLRAKETRRMLDFEQPIGLLAVTLFHYISPERDPFAILARYRDAVAPGSYLGITHLTLAERIGQVAELMKSTQNNVYPRDVSEIEALFGDFELVDEGLRPVADWLPVLEPDTVDNPEANRLLAGVGRKPS